MRLLMTAGAPTLAAALLGCCLSMPANAADVTDQRLLNADSEPQNWLLPFQNYSSQRFSRLDEINRDNIANLKAAFTVPLSTGLNGRAATELENHAIVDDGMLYVDDGGGVIYKIDVTSGDRGVIAWIADAAVAKDIGARSRGVAAYGNAIIHNLRDGRVVAVDRDTGEFIWDQQVARLDDHPKGSGLSTATETFTASPLPADGKILVGQSNGDAGNRGWLAALDPATGDEIWRTYTIPAPGEPGSETWKDDHNAWKTGGGSLWTTGSYDAEQRVTIWGTANPVPMFDPEYRPGDNLFTNSAIAFGIDDGAMKWYFQYTPNDSWDYDENGAHLLYDVEIDGQTRKVVGHYARNGFFYQLDRTNGQFINATSYITKVTWTAGIDPKTGKPVEYDPNLDLQTYIPATRFLRGESEADNQPACPHMVGGVRWQPQAYNPDKHLVYQGATDGCFLLPVIEVEALGPEGGINGDAPGARIGAQWAQMQTSDFHGRITAVDATTGKLVAHLDQPYENMSGILATAGGLIFSATADGNVTAHNDETLEEVWHFNTGTQIKAPPIAYSVNGKEYIAIVAGSPAPGTQPFMMAHPELASMQPAAMLYVFSL